MEWNSYMEKFWKYNYEMNESKSNVIKLLIFSWLFLEILNSVNQVSYNWNAHVLAFPTTPHSLQSVIFERSYSTVHMVRSHIQFHWKKSLSRRHYMYHRLSLDMLLGAIFDGTPKSSFPLCISWNNDKILSISNWALP